MGTEKRERQKLNRQQRLIEEARAERTALVKRNVVRWGLAATLAVGAVVLIAWIGGAFSGDDEAETDTPVLTQPPIVTDPVVTTPPGGTTAPDPTTGKPSVQVPETVPTDLVITDVVVGEGSPAAVGDTVEVNYVGVRSVDGVEFDNSYDRGAAFPVTIGTTSVIEGWTEGLVGVREGGVRQLDIPADMAYGDQGSPPLIRPDEAISFVVEVVSVTPGATE